MHRLPLLPLTLLVLVAVAPPPALAGDCAGGSIRRLRLGPDRVAASVTVTRRGLTPASLVGSAGLDLHLEDANDGTPVWSLSIPADRFTARGATLRYGGGAELDGTVRIHPFGPQADTVVIDVLARHTTVAGGPGRPVRARIGDGASCARSCVAACVPHGAAQRCKPSPRYVPFADQGFGAPRGRVRSRTSAYCGLAIDAGARCDFLIDDRCLLPYPSSYFLADDPTTPTGKRVHYGPAALPANAGGKHIDPADWNTLDGFSPGPVIVALFPDTGFPVDLAASDVAFHTSYARSLEADHPTVLLETSTGQRVVHFAEMDANTADVTRKALLIRPGRRLDDATRYVVAIRDLVDTHGTPITARLAFRALRDGADNSTLDAACGTPCAAAIAARRASFEDLFARLGAAGVSRQDLVLAWDFTTASTPALTGWMRSIRDQAAQLPTPAFEVTGVDDGPGGLGRNANIFRRVQGVFHPPLFMTADAPGSRLNLVGGVPAQNGFADVPFVVDIPHVTVNLGGQPNPARATTWGHGLLGSRTQLGALAALAQGFNFVITAVDMQGMSDPDVPSIVPILSDYSLFHRIPERLHQGFLNHLELGRLMADPIAGFNSHPAFQFGSPPVGVIDTNEVTYSGGSQGGIFGTAIMSFAEVFTRGFLAVPGANYSTLLHRSIDFNPFLAIARGAYPDRLDEQLTLGLVQQLWDRAEPQGYMNHLVSGDLSDPPVPHKVLVHMATYDCEVSNVATEIMVRSLGIPQVTPVHRTFFQIPERAAPFDDSAFVEVDPQLGFPRCNVPGSSDPGQPCTTDADCPGAGDKPTRTRCDPAVPPESNTAPPFNNRAHGSTGNATTGQQIAEFLRSDGTVQQFCTGTCNPD